MKRRHLKPEHLNSVKQSYFNILGLFLHEDQMKSRYLRCLLKWGFQLQLSPEDLRKSNVDLAVLSYAHPDEKLQKLEAIYHLVYMIYLDEVVEEVELEVATIYAQTLGFGPETVSELFKSIATQDYDTDSERDVREEILDFLSLNRMSL